MKFLGKKKLVTAITTAVLAMSVLVSGCGSSEDDANKIKLGVVSEMTGANATYGNSIVNGIQLAVKEQNAKGGLLNKQIEIVVADDKSEPAEAANAMSKLINQDNVKAVMGIFPSSNAIAAANVSESSKIPFLAIGATNPKVTVNDDGTVKPHTFRVCFIDPFQGTVGANFVYNELGAKTAAIYIDNSSDYAKGLAAAFKDAYTAAGGIVIDEESYLQKDTDFKSVLTKIKAAAPDVVYVPGYYEEVGKIIKQARELGINIPFVGGDGWDSPKLAEIAGSEALNNTYFTNHYSVDSSDETSKAFVENYNKEYGQNPDACAVLGYDGANLMIETIAKAGVYDAAKITEILAATKDFNAVTGKTSLNETHDAVKSAVILEYKDGKQTYRATVNP
ncbi:MAG: ethanolamine utilization protein EutJ [Phascolarctobacterium sp.]|nr:MAG: ethanolamine utilization protein EutJ [Phascolarctobacterium sp.]